MTNRPRHKSRLSSPDQHLRRLIAEAMNAPDTEDKIA